MSEEMNLVFQSIERNNLLESAHTRRQLIKGAGAILGGMGLVGLLPVSAFASASSDNTPQNILTVAATAEVLATIVNTIGYNSGLGGDAVTQANIAAAAREELIHYNVLVASGATPATTKIWVPDAVFANRTNFLNTLAAGDQIFVNAYLIGTGVFGTLGNQGGLAAITAEFMGVEAVHRALARQSLGLLGNDRVFMAAPFTDILTAVTELKAAGFGFGEVGATPGKFYEFDKVSKSTPNPSGLNTFTPTPLF